VRYAEIQAGCDIGLPCAISDLFRLPSETPSETPRAEKAAAVAAEPKSAKKLGRPNKHTEGYIAFSQKIRDAVKAETPGNPSLVSGNREVNVVIMAALPLLMMLSSNAFHVLYEFTEHGMCVLCT
jgi:hypothetical protein